MLIGFRCVNEFEEDIDWGLVGKNLSEIFHPLPASLSRAPGNLPGGLNAIEAVSRLVLVDGKWRYCLKLLTTT
ncbi:Uncharacterized protein APZ42_019215 [Daphnia magna]|uniref:Uncharacterized protein n=1 Tax=Daphnia magna TaxID=35525 RepID=A0A164YDT8_9CRUS|nr:Uncharacterized protein APZ42_019215 [Daphnia magna]